MMYTVLEFALVGLIVSFSAYHVLNLLLPKAMQRMRMAAGQLLGRTTGMQAVARRLQSSANSSACGGCDTNAGCKSCAAGLKGERSLDDTTQKSVT